MKIKLTILFLLVFIPRIWANEGGKIMKGFYEGMTIFLIVVAVLFFAALIIPFLKHKIYTILSILNLSFILYVIMNPHWGSHLPLGIIILAQIVVQLLASISMAIWANRPLDLE